MREIRSVKRAGHEIGTLVPMQSPEGFVTNNGGQKKRNTVRTFQFKNIF